MPEFEPLTSVSRNRHSNHMNNMLEYGSGRSGNGCSSNGGCKSIIGGRNNSSGINCSGGGIGGCRRSNSSNFLRVKQTNLHNTMHIKTT